MSGQQKTEKVYQLPFLNVADMSDALQDIPPSYALLHHLYFQLIYFLTIGHAVCRNSRLPGRANDVKVELEQLRVVDCH